MARENRGGSVGGLPGSVAGCSWKTETVSSVAGNVRPWGGGIVTTDLALQLLGDMLLTALFISAPILIPIMVVGLLISLLQVVTQVQEMSLTFVPKIITAFVSV